MKISVLLVAAALTAVAGAAVANAQAPLTSPYQTLVLQPGATVIRETPLFAIPAAQPIEIISTVQTVPTIRSAPARHHIAARHKIQDRLVTIEGGQLYNMATAPVVQTAATTALVQIQAAATPVVVVEQGLSGEFQCIAGCAAGSAGPAFVTQNGWGLNLVNEVGQPSRAWIDYPGHIWVQSWNEGAVYSPDQMTIQFDDGTVWSKNIILVAPPVRR
jgi:hypothetical protein